QCSWTIKSPDPKYSVSLPKDTVHNVSSEICRALGCGECGIEHDLFHKLCLSQLSVEEL
ncbi:hypothetical protein M9458_037791, partial [Cirrhinus mrigala]